MLQNVISSPASKLHQDDLQRRLFAQRCPVKLNVDDAVILDLLKVNFWQVPIAHFEAESKTRNVLPNENFR